MRLAREVFFFVVSQHFLPFKKTKPIGVCQLPFSGLLPHATLYPSFSIGRRQQNPLRLYSLSAPAPAGYDEGTRKGYSIVVSW
jgi:hypothetical protein